jgi:hypothetical protein
LTSAGFISCSKGSIKTLLSDIQDGALGHVMTREDLNGFRHRSPFGV